MVSNPVSRHGRRGWGQLCSVTAFIDLQGLGMETLKENGVRDDQGVLTMLHLPEGKHSDFCKI